MYNYLNFNPFFSKKDKSLAVKEKERELKQAEEEKEEKETQADSLLSNVENYKIGEYPTLDELRKYRQDYQRKEKTASDNKEKAARRMLTRQADVNSKMKELNILRRELNENRARVEHASYSEISDEKQTITGAPGSLIYILCTTK